MRGGATTDKITLVVSKEADGKMRVTSGSWEGEKVFSRNQVLELRNFEGRLHVSRKERHHDDWDPPIEPYDPYGSDERFDVVWRRCRRVTT